MPDSSTSLTTSNQSSDESLALSCSSGDNSAFDVLFHRYAEQVRLFLLSKSWFKNDDQYIDELVEQSFVVLWQCLKANKFESKGDGSFRKWLFSICHLECFKQDSNRANLPKTTSTLFPASFVDIPVPARKQAEPEDESLHNEQINEQLKEVLSKLTPKEQRLMQMVADRVKYEDILKDPEFREYKSVDSIKKKIYRIRKRFNKS